jgi:hypothetical protein
MYVVSSRLNVLVRYTLVRASKASAGQGIANKHIESRRDDIVLHKMSELGLQLELEDHRYFNLNQFCGYGDLSLAGVSFGVCLEF